LSDVSKYGQKARFIAGAGKRTCIRPAPKTQDVCRLLLLHGAGDAAGPCPL